MLPTPNTHWTIDRPVVVGVLKDLIQITRISHTTPISFYSEEAKSYQQGSTLASEGIEENLWPHDERLFVEVKEEVDLDRIYSNRVAQNEHPHIFSDSALGISIKPVYFYTKLSISVKYRASDRNKAEMWRNEMAVRAAMLRDINLHELEFGFEIPEAFLFIIEELHRLRENVAGYGQDLNDYFTSNLSTNTSLTTNLNASTFAWCTKERQIGVQGWFEFDKVPDKAERENDHDAYTSSFSYVLHYQKPIASNMTYPLMVHQQVLDAKFRPEEKAYSLYDQPAYYSQSGRAAAYFSSDARVRRIGSKEGVSIPAYDEFKPRTVPSSSVKIFNVMVCVTSEDKRTLINLGELGDFVLDSDILEFIKTSEHTFMTGDYQSILQLNLYSNSEQLDKGCITLSNDLTLSATRDLDLRKVYHVRMSVITNISYLPVQALKRIQQNPVVGMKLVNAINASITGFNGSRADIRKQILSVEDVLLLTSKQLSPSYMRGHYPYFIAEMFTGTTKQKEVLIKNT
jgi:hypothetical protein